MELSEDVLMELEALESIYGEDYESESELKNVCWRPDNPNRDRRWGSYSSCTESGWQR